MYSVAKFSLFVSVHFGNLPILDSTQRRISLTLITYLVQVASTNLKSSLLSNIFSGIQLKFGIEQDKFTREFNYFNFELNSANITSKCSKPFFKIIAKYRILRKVSLIDLSSIFAISNNDKD